MVLIADLTNGGHALSQYVAHLTRGQPEKGVFAVLGQELRRSASATDELSASADLHLNIVHLRAISNGT
jgi:hypothetical protein